MVCAATRPAIATAPTLLSCRSRGSRWAAPTTARRTAPSYPPLTMVCAAPAPRDRHGTDRVVVPVEGIGIGHPTHRTAHRTVFPSADDGLCGACARDRHGTDPAVVPVEGIALGHATHRAADRTVVPSADDGLCGRLTAIATALTSPTCR